MKTWLYGYFGHMNIGDEAILAAVSKQLSQAGQTPYIFTDNVSNSQKTVPGRYFLTPPLDSESFKNYWRYSFSYWAKNIWQLAPLLMHQKSCIYACGGSMNDHVPGRIEGMLRRIMQLRRMGFKVAIIGAGIDCIDSPGDRAAAKTLIEENLDYFSVRDVESAEVLISLGISPERFFVAADPVYGMASPKILPKRHLPLKESLLGLNLRPLFQNSSERGSDKSYRYSTYHEKCCVLLQSLSNRAKRIQLIPFAPEDETFLASLARPSNVEIVPFDPNPDRMLRYMQNIDVLVGMRLHSIVFAVMGDKPVVPVIYSKKVKNLACELGFDPSGLFVGDGIVTNDQLLQIDEIGLALDNLWTNTEVFLKRSRKLVLDKRNLASEDFSRCWNVLNGKGNIR